MSIYTVFILLSVACLGVAAPQSADPKTPQSYLDLAQALCRQGRDSADLDAYKQADQAIDRALELSPGNQEALRLRILVLLGRHDFVTALAQATQLSQRFRDDVVVWGYLAEANSGLGEYAEALKDAQWILDLRRGSTLGFTEAAKLRDIHGDPEGASQYYDQALLRTDQNHVEDRAWLMTLNARSQMTLGNLKRAGELLANALTLNPTSQFTMWNLAQLKAVHGNFAEAVLLCEKRAKTAKAAGPLFDLASMLEKSGRAPEAEAAFQQFETKAKAEMSNTLNDNRDLVFYYADHRNSPAEALAIAAKDATTRHDSETLDAYAWALFRSGKLAEAQTQMERALAPGIRDGGYFCHALQIAQARQDGEGVKRFQKELSGMPACNCAAFQQSSK